MAGVKECSSGLLGNFFTYLYGSTFRIEVVTSSSPTSLAGASSGACLVRSTVGSYPTTNYFTAGTSGNNQYIAISACSCDDVINSGNAACVILFNVSCSEVMYVTTCTTQALTSGNKANIGTWSITINQPT